MKIKNRNLLTVILAMLCTVAIALGVGFVLPKNETKTAYAATDLFDGGKLSNAALDDLAVAASYTDYTAMIEDVADNGVTLNASNFGGYTLTYGGKQWFPVYMQGNTLTLWLSSSLGSYKFSDGTSSGSTATPTSNNYATSWIHAAINAGHTNLGYYYGSFSGASRTQYQNSVKSPSAPCAPTAFTTLAAFASGGTYSSFIVPGFGGDNLWLPDVNEAKLGGTWGCTSAYFGVKQWTRTPFPNYPACEYYIFESGAPDAGSLDTVTFTYGVRPCINLDLSSAERRINAPTGVSVTYNGLLRDITDSEILAADKAWYRSSLMNLTYPTANATDMKDTSTYTVKVELTATAIAANYLFRGVADPTKGAGDESDTLRYFTYKINQKQIAVPTVPGTPQEYSGSVLTHNFSNYDKTEVEVTGVKVTSKEGSFTLVSTGTNSWATSGGGYPVTVDDSGSIVQVKATEAGEYTVEFGLLDTLNTTWATSSHSTTFTVERATITVGFGSPVAAGGFSWQVGDYSTTNPGYLSVQTIGNIQNGEPVTVDLYWYKSTATSTSYPMYTTGVPDTTQYDVTMFDSFGTGTYYLCAVLANDASGVNVNRNYKIATDDTNVSPVKNEVAVQQLSINAGSASLDNIVWQYGTPTLPDSNVTGATITYDVQGGVAVAYTVKAINFPSYCTPTYSNATKSTAGTHTTTVRLVIDAAHQADNKMPNPATGYTYGGEGRYTYINDTTCEIEFDWTIEQKEVDLSNVSFEYSNDGGTTWKPYNSANPPEATGFDLFEVRVPATAIANTGILGATPQNYSNQYGPGVVDFEFAFTLDPNYKALSGQNQSGVPYSMTTTGKQIQLNWLRTTLKDAGGNDVKDANNIPYYVYELDLSSVPNSAIPYIRYEYYTDGGSTYGSIISGTDIEKHLGMGYIIDPTGMDANSMNPKQVWVRAVLVGVPQVAGVDTFVLVDSPANPEYKKITVGDNRRAVDLSAGTLTSMTYGDTVNIADAYKVVDRLLTSDMPAASYKVSLYNGSTQITPDVSGFDFSTLDAGNYTLSFELVGNYDNTHILTSSSLPFEVKGIQLIAPTLKDGVTLTFSGEIQYLIDYLQNFDPTYMEFASNSIDDGYHASTYTAVIKIKDQYKGNYVFVLPASTSATTKKPVKSLVDNPVTLPSLSDGDTVAALDWTINKYVYDTTPKSAWNFAKDGATLSFNGVPATIKALTLGNDPTLIFGVAYYDLDGNPLTDVELKGGNKYQVAAYLDPSCADANDIEFKGQVYDPLTSLTTSPQTAYTVPQSGAAAFMGNVKEFMSKTWLGLPIWAWLLIALALIILLIIIIVVACKRRKTKEEKEEIKARKQEEKERREEERRLQQEKLEAERELAKAKQEAELEKIRAQAQAATGAGMASMAVQHPQQQVQPVQQVQSVDNELLREMRQQMAELRADNKATQAQLQAMQNNQQMPQPMQYPMYPQYQQMPAQMPMMPQYPQYGDGNALARMEAQLNAMQAEQRARYDAEQRIELAAMRAEQHVDRDSRHSVDLAAMREHINGYNYNRIPDYSNQQPNSIEALGAIVAAALKNISAPAQPVAELPQQTEASTPAEVKYPSDAVITTTTTVDTTKNKPIRREREEDDGRIFDSDGFYDPLD
ncbi:MAG: hypothetical protein K2N22_04480 [Clostridia bacterium]|nr:hypothetical protein [Clostridia bacterium]